MRTLKKIIFISILFLAATYAQEERKVLIEVFTNSHCPHCPAAHNTVDDYLSNSPNVDRLNYIFYHMSYPYLDDLLYQQSMEDSDARNLFYNPVQATPQGFIDGELQVGHNTWGDALDDRMIVGSPFTLNLLGTADDTNINITAAVKRIGDVADNDLVMNFVLVEDVFYAGRNGITDHKHVMRKMFPSPDGKPFSINLNETKDIEATVAIDPLWNTNEVNIVVFIQSTVSKNVYQSETINYSDLSPSAINDESDIPLNFHLEQNYPNPFNPNTRIQYSVNDKDFVELKVYDVLGKEVATLVAEEKPSGTYRVDFDASFLSSGTYFYRLQAGENIETKKMILLR